MWAGLRRARAEDRLRARAVAEMERRAARQPRGAGVRPPAWYRRTWRHAGRPAAWKKDWVDGRVRPRTKMDDMVEGMAPGKRAEWVRRERARRGLEELDEDDDGIEVEGGSSGDEAGDEMSESGLE